MPQLGFNYLGPQGSHPKLHLQRAALVQSWRHFLNTQWTLLPPCKQSLAQKYAPMLLNLGHFPTLAQMTIISLTRKTSLLPQLWDSSSSASMRVCKLVQHPELAETVLLWIHS